MSEVAAPASAAPSESSSAPNTPAAPRADATSPGKAPHSTAPKGVEKLIDRDEPAKKDAGPSDAEKAAQKAAEKRKYKLKVDGAEEELELSDDEITLRLQKERAASKRMQESAELKKKFAEAVDLIKKDPFSALKDPAFGLDLEQLAEQRLIEKYQREMLPEEERQRMDMEKKLQEYQRREQEAHEAQQRQAYEAQVAQVQQQTEQDFLKALELAGAGKDYEVLAEMVDLAKHALGEYGLELSPEQLAAEVKSRREARETKAWEKARGLRGDALLKQLGDEVVQEVLRLSVSRVKTNNPFQQAEAPRQVETEAKGRQMKTNAQFRRELGLK
jgi:hypothetical protein